MFMQQESRPKCSARKFLSIATHNLYVHINMKSTLHMISLCEWASHTPAAMVMKDSTRQLSVFQQAVFSDSRWGRCNS